MTRPLLLITALTLSACADTTNPYDDDHDHDHDLITRVALVFTPAGGGTAATFEWSSHDGDVEVDDIVLSDGSTYDLAIQFWNDEASPPEDISEEIAEEGDTHQVFVTGTAVQGPATGDNAGGVVTQSYDDVDDNGLPLGLQHTIVATGTGEGTFLVTLRHLPPESGSDTKVADLAEAVAEGGFGAIGGETDVQVTFSLTVE